MDDVQAAERDLVSLYERLLKASVIDRLIRLQKTVGDRESSDDCSLHAEVRDAARQAKNRNAEAKETLNSLVEDVQSVSESLRGFREDVQSRSVEQHGELLSAILGIEGIVAAGLQRSDTAIQTGSSAIVAGLHENARHLEGLQAVRTATAPEIAAHLHDGVLAAAAQITTKLESDVLAQAAASKRLALVYASSLQNLDQRLQALQAEVTSSSSMQNECLRIVSTIREMHELAVSESSKCEARVAGDPAGGGALAETLERKLGEGEEKVRAIVLRCALLGSTLWLFQFIAWVWLLVAR